MTNDLELELDELRNSISSYCINTCKSKCCRKGKLLLQNETELKTIVSKNKISPYLKKNILEKSKITPSYYFDLEKIGGCKYLSGTLCTIHNSPDKPKICSDFPIFKFKNSIITSSFCPAVENGIMDEKLKKISEKYNLKLI